jgi:hypothetical protein
MNKDNRMTVCELVTGMSDMAASCKNDAISNALSRVSSKIETLGDLFSTNLTDTDMIVVKYYFSELQKVK